MLTWTQLHSVLEQAANRHRQLLLKFDQFAKNIKAQVTSETFHIRGIETSLQLEQGYFTVAFAGRTIYFVFSTVMTEVRGTLKGTVTCYFQIKFPEEKYVEIGKLEFTGSGQTDFIPHGESDALMIDYDIHALHIALHFIHTSLFK